METRGIQKQAPTNVQSIKQRTKLQEDMQIIMTTSLDREEAWGGALGVGKGRIEQCAQAVPTEMLIFHCTSPGRDADSRHILGYGRQ